MAPDWGNCGAVWNGLLWKNPVGWSPGEPQVSISPLASSPAIGKRKKKRGCKQHYYEVYYACGRDTSCILNAYDIVPTSTHNSTPNSENPPYLVITDTTLHKWHIVNVNQSKFVEVYCTNSCCVLGSPMDATVYIDAIRRGASEDALLDILFNFQGHDAQGRLRDQDEDLVTMMFRIIYRIPLDTFNPLFIQEKMNQIEECSIEECSIEECRVVEVPTWLWWYMEPSEHIGVCSDHLPTKSTGLEQFLES